MERRAKSKQGSMSVSGVVLAGEAVRSREVELRAGRWLILAAAGLAMAHCAPAAHGAVPYRIECPDRHVVVGFAGRVGAWVDNIALLCAGWDASAQRLGPPAAQPRIGESNGGDALSKRCPDGMAVGADYRIAYARDPRVLHSIEFTCVPIDGSSNRIARSFGSDSEISKAPLIPIPITDGPGVVVKNRCAAGQLVNGIQGTSGLYIDQLLPICNPAPELAAAPAPPKPLGRKVSTGLSVKPVKDLAQAGTAPGLGSAIGASRAIDAVGAAGFGGSWTTLYGPMTIRVDGDKAIGEYPKLNGRVEGTVRGDQWQGRWTEGAQSGEVTFTLQGRDRFLGCWRVGSSGQPRCNWQGTRD
ncbi:MULTISPECIES: hypothetical protein [unclassified Lysobacter]|uniref:hypothetical protein n=1 Tax=unclassified Lysobacter TaxID=2635362 RepID=UPI001BE7E581|nr:MULTISPECIES: hypothetical protein [unclassified Lysobacter]MBT2747884.1 hypothetical protein [Lysobacter sp. ISL-42]MBT2753776.1 hypothetical protein [Lysobacter sp. ISL-50]MBT2779064.1 hypothetical protein [Lysobacter sp. ISL-54]